MYYSDYHTLQDQAIRRSEIYPADRFAGRGIVICAGGARLFSSAWVELQALRSWASTRLPIQIWHRGPDEMDAAMTALLEGLNAEVIDASTLPAYKAFSALHGWAFKPFAIFHSRFKEVIFLDADNLPLVDPEVLFESPGYLETGALFWPDIDPLPQKSAIWEICRVPYRREPSFESGQIVIDKERCWKALSLAMHMNEHSDFYYKHVYGDKDLFHMAWRMLNQPYSMTSRSVQLMKAEDSDPLFGFTGPVLGQHDFRGEVIFQHRNHPKWIVFGKNPRYPEFRHEEECLEFLRELAALWDGRVSSLKLRRPVAAASNGTANNGTKSRWFRYVRISSDERLVELLPDQRIGAGSSPAEERWRVVDHGGQSVLETLGLGSVTSRLSRRADGVWRGNWVRYERLPVELIPYIEDPNL